MLKRLFYGTSSSNRLQPTGLNLLKIAQPRENVMRRVAVTLTNSQPGRFGLVNKLGQNQPNW